MVTHTYTYTRDKAAVMSYENFAARMRAEGQLYVKFAHACDLQSRV